MPYYCSRCDRDWDKASGADLNCPRCGIERTATRATMGGVDE